MFFHIDEESANVVDVTTKVRSGFGDENLILVNANGLRIEDSDATRGIKNDYLFHSNVFIILVSQIIK